MEVFGDFLLITAKQASTLWLSHRATHLGSEVANHPTNGAKPHLRRGVAIEKANRVSCLRAGRFVNTRVDVLGIVIEEILLLMQTGSQMAPARA